MGWLLTGDTVENIPTDSQENADKLGSLILPAEHTIACDYNYDGVNQDSKAQYFKIYNSNVELTKTIKKDDSNADVGVIWTDKLFLLQGSEVYFIAVLNPSAEDC